MEMIDIDRDNAHLLIQLTVLLKIAPSGFEITSNIGTSVVVADDPEGRFSLYKDYGALYLRTDDASTAAQYLIG